MSEKEYLKESVDLINAQYEQAKAFEEFGALSIADQLLAKIREDAERGDPIGTHSGGYYLERYLESVGITPPKTTRQRLDDLEYRMADMSVGIGDRLAKLEDLLGVLP